jgi:hypothetical protein
VNRFERSLVISMNSLLAALALLPLFACAVCAQDTPGRSVGVLLTHSVTSGASAHGPVCPCQESRDVLAPVSVSSLEVDVAWPLARGGWWGADYSVRAVPFALVRDNPTEAAERNRNGPGWTISSRTARGSTVGLGIKPVGVRAWAGGRRLALLGEASGGVVRFGTPLLAANGTRVNFVAEVGVGVRLDLPGRARAIVGYKWHHLSNAGLGEVNPGLDSDLVSVGFWFE